MSIRRATSSDGLGGVAWPLPLVGSAPSSAPADSAPPTSEPVAVSDPTVAPSDPATTVPVSTAPPATAPATTEPAPEATAAPTTAPPTTAPPAPQWRPATEQFPDLAFVIKADGIHRVDADGNEHPLSSASAGWIRPTALEVSGDGGFTIYFYAAFLS